MTSPLLSSPPAAPVRGTGRRRATGWSAWVGAGGAGVAAMLGVVVAGAMGGVALAVTLPGWLGEWRSGEQVSALWASVAVVATAALCLVWVRLLRQWSRADRTPSLRTVAVMAACWAAALLPTAPLASLDITSYAAVGRLAALGLDPYRTSAGVLTDAYGAAVSPMWLWTPTPYGPLQVWLLGVAAWFGGSSALTTMVVIRVVAVVAMAAAVAAAVVATRREERVAVLALTALNPLVLIHVVSGAHLDALIGLAAVGVVMAVRAGHREVAVVIAVAAAMVKLPGLVLIGYVLADALRRSAPARRPMVMARVAAAASATVALAMVVFPDPFGWVRALGVPGITRSGMAPSTWVSLVVADVTGWTTGYQLDSAFSVGRILTEVVGVAGVALLLWRAAAGSTRSAYRDVGGALVLLALTGPSTFPWYLVWGLFAAAIGAGPRGRAALAVLSVLLCLAGSVSSGIVPIVVMALALAVLAWDWFRARETSLAFSPVV